MITSCLLYLTLPVGSLVLTPNRCGVCVICLYADFCIVMSHKVRRTREACFDTLAALMSDRSVGLCGSVDRVFHSVASTFGYTLMPFFIRLFPFPVSLL